MPSSVEEVPSKDDAVSKSSANSSDLSSKLPRLTPRRRAPPPSNPLPVPSTPSLPPPPELSGIIFTRPTRRILSPRDHQSFLASGTHTLLLSFIFSLTESVQDKKVSDIRRDDLSPVVGNVLRILDQVEDCVHHCPAEDQGGSRFGNPAFQALVDRIAEANGGWQERLGIEDAGAREEAGTYLQQAFGNRTRIDYGSGHELNFMVWLLCLYQLGLLTQVDFASLVLVAFTRYLHLMRLIQTTYYLEPAGSHGVWGLDDYQFLPFLFGSSQLLHHPYIRPLSIHNNLILEEEGDDYMYLDQVRFVESVKNVKGLRWHSPMLDDISTAKGWDKVEAGMRRMFVAEVLGKLPVMQHFLFGSLVPAVDGMSKEDKVGVASEEEETEGGEVVVMQDGMKHVHQNTGWGDCCGIKVPSSIGAAQEMKKRTGQEGLRRVPFD